MPQLAKLFTKANRGLLLDVVVFIANIFLMRLLTRQFIELFSQVSAENPLAQMALGFILLAMWFLPAAGAVLKRWHFQQRRHVSSPLEITGMGGCLFNPIFYFCLNLVIASAVLTSLGQFVFGKRALQGAPVSVLMIFLILILTIVQTYLIYSISRLTKSRRAGLSCVRRKANCWATSFCS